MRRKLLSFSSTHICKPGMGGTLLLSIRFEILLSNKHCDLMTPKHCNYSEADTPVYDKYDKAGSYNSLCSHCCQSSGWALIKTTAKYKSIPSTQILARSSFGATPLTYLNWVGHDITVVAWVEQIQSINSMDKHT